nr:DNA-binding protein [uncultured Prevotella sp.]
MILINLKKNKNEKMPNAFGKYYAFPVINQTIGMDGLSEHMASHNTPFSAGAIKGMLTDLVSCIRELTLQGIAVKIDNLAIFSIGIKNKCGAASEKDFSVAKNIESVKLRARATGVLMSDRLKLDATIKRASAILGDDSSNGENSGGGSVNGDAGGSGVNKPSGGNTQESGGTSQGTGSENGGSGEDNEL